MTEFLTADSACRRWESFTYSAVFTIWPSAKGLSQSANSSWIPVQSLRGFQSLLSDIGAKVETRDQKFVMAKGEVITRDIGYAIVKVNGFETVDEIVFARSGDLTLVGSRTLEGFGAIVDASRKQLVAAGPYLAA